MGININPSNKRMIDDLLSPALFKLNIADDKKKSALILLQENVVTTQDSAIEKVYYECFHVVSNTFLRRPYEEFEFAISDSNYDPITGIFTRALNSFSDSDFCDNDSIAPEFTQKKPKFILTEDISEEHFTKTIDALEARIKKLKNYVLIIAHRIKYNAHRKEKQPHELLKQLKQEIIFSKQKIKNLNIRKPSRPVTPDIEKPKLKEKFS